MKRYNKIIVTRDEKLSYVGNAKSGNTSLANFIYFYDNGYYYPHGEIHRSKHAFKRLDYREVRKRNIYTFSFVRNPYLRLVSAFRSKFVSTLDEKYSGFRDLLTSNYNCNPAGDQCDNFRRFIEFVQDSSKKKGLINMNPHWRPQVVNLGLEAIRYNAIGKLEHMSEQFPVILQEAGIDKLIYESAGNKIFNATNASSLDMNLYYSEKEIAFVQEAYKEDFKSFGYRSSPSRLPIDSSIIRDYE